MTEQLTKYCPWRDYHSTALSDVHRHMDIEHDFLKGAYPPINPEYTLDFDPGKVFTL